MNDRCIPLQSTMPLEVGVACSDIARQRHFYEQVLRLAFVGEVAGSAQASSAMGFGPGGYQVVRLQTSRGERIKLLQPHEPLAPNAPKAHVLSRAGICYLTFGVASLEHEMRRLMAAGVVFSSGAEPLQLRQGVSVALCSDPEGNVIELVQIDALAKGRASEVPASAAGAPKAARQ